ncbi:hypothetical protein [Neobacillus sp. DY30]|uniref:hypothetical protein n=1 Tax=Neobacillus sp. DY30 TaxID=3047871 RepID=UPI0024BF6A43|nr:hypothetical protein [Neobacillus sp. DY30]WHY03249.1 hypothetical protein QNH29_13950 [Neobacillus sp. DY30]
MNKQKQYRHELLEWCHETAKSLSEQIELLYRDSNADEEEIEVNSVNSLEMEEQIQLEEENFEPLTIQNELEIQFDQYIDMEELNQYREELLQWCNTLYSSWNITKPMLSNLVDNDILEGWEGMCTRLKEKLQEDLPLENEDYETATALYEQWEKLLEDSYSYQEEHQA